MIVSFLRLHVSYMCSAKNAAYPEFQTSYKPLAAHRIAPGVVEALVFPESARHRVSSTALLVGLGASSLAIQQDESHDRH